MIRQAVVLAAGKGTRLRASDDDLPKPLQQIGGVPLIKRTIITLARAGVSDVVVVTGFMADQIRGALEGDPSFAEANVAVSFAHNAEFERANGISVIVGGRSLRGPFMLSMADHIYTASIARLVGEQDLTAADLYLATDPRITEVLDVDDATKVQSDAGRIVAISKTLTTYDRIDCGVFAVTSRLVDVLEELRTESGDCALSDGVRRLAALGRARVADIGDGYWQDVDTPADRAAAEAAITRRPA
jgi:choline kinase